ncbi:hypothetical protein GCM10007857_90160 [Bradyrhizobium iriomotense]|uniref:Uncharacterized protein n=1 Tax=Bradyrhizobium iriomotense TaxID=441950 RepID=A0ABQ6BD16_9BRAD|nr:hypothetical protein GCM10007857_90160 [Bradyrhizobium iriomotense]
MRLTLGKSRTRKISVPRPLCEGESRTAELIASCPVSDNGQIVSPSVVYLAAHRIDRQEPDNGAMASSIM